MKPWPSFQEYLRKLTRLKKTKERRTKMPTITYAAARKNARLTQKEAAKRLNISVGTLCNYEIGKTSPRQETLIRMAKVYNIPVGLLMN